MDQTVTTRTAVVACARPLVLAGLRATVGGDEALDVVDAVGTEGIVEAVTRHQPDLLVIAVHGREDDPFREVASAVAVADDLHVLAIADAASVVELREAIVAGVQSLLLGDATIEQVRDAARDTADGQRVLDPEIAIQLAGSWADDVGVPEASLTSRELDVLRLLAEGMTNKQIGAELDLAPRTVKTHVQNLLVKLDTPDRTGAVAQGFRRGLIT